MSEAKLDRWALLEDPPEYAQKTAKLYHWSLNFDPGRGPFEVLLDLIGWTEDEGLEARSTPSEFGYQFGWAELAYLGAALTEYARDPWRVRDWIDDIIAAEMAEP